jgi:hypothetical protein
MVSLYNSGVWLQNRIENLLKSSIIDQLDIWCVNADSPDPLDHEIPRNYPVRYVRLPHRISVYETWNYIISNSTCEYLTNANTDDLVSPVCYARLMASLDHRKEAGFSYPSWYTTNIANQQWGSLKEIGESKPGVYAGDLNKAGVGHFPMWRRKLHDKLGLFRSEFKALGDAEWWARCYHKAHCRFLWLQEPLACYLFRNGENLWHRSVNESEWALYHQLVQQYRNVG